MNHIEKTLREELVPALGCTEPIALAYAGAKGKELLGTMPDKIQIECSINIIKNVKSVYVPKTGGLKGIESAVLAGVVGGDASKKLEVLNSFTEEDAIRVKELLETNMVSVSKLDTPLKLDFIVKLKKDDREVLVRISNAHTHISKLIIDGETVHDSLAEDMKFADEDSRSLELTEIVDYALNGDISNVEDVIEQQIKLNKAISAEGLRNPYGMQIGSSWRELHDDTVENRAISLAAAGSDARMAGCDLPVVINSGSGNQGVTASMPVIAYAEEIGASDEKLKRALILSNLLALYQKENIGKLSAYCGVVNAASGSAAAICWLLGGNREQFLAAMEYVLGTLSGMICDGAKASCASKIAASIQTAILGAKLSLQNTKFSGGDGIIKSSPKATVDSVVRLARDGLKETDNVIVDIMLQDN